MRGGEGGREGGGDEDEEGERGDGGREGVENEVIVLKISGEGRCKVESFSGSWRIFSRKSKCRLTVGRMRRMPYVWRCSNRRV